MANALYPKAKEALLKADIDMEFDTLKVVAVDLATYTYSTAHQFLSDIPVGERVSTSANLTGRTLTDGTFKSADAVFTAVAGDPFEAIVLYKDTGTEGTSALIMYVSDDQGGPIAITPDGTNVNLKINAAGWISL